MLSADENFINKIYADETFRGGDEERQAMSLEP